ncbi:MAG: leucyl aminopeptidase [Nitrospira sp.]|nr:leucyl aminopeptidase [Candidatus Manganitrophaceae bacterium]HIL35560.1 leucyl aminopeptidase [Candidatus Manganitrophaceae bacterium]
MEITVKQGSVLKAKGEILILTHYEGEDLAKEIASVDKAIGGLIREVIATEGFAGKFLQTTLIRPNGKTGFPRLLIIGLGKRNEVTLDHIRKGMGRAATLVREIELGEISIPVYAKQVRRVSIRDLSQAIIEGVLLGLYQFQRYKTERPNTTEIKNCTLLSSDRKSILDIRIGANRGNRIAEAVRYVRDLCNTPSNMATPSHLAEEAVHIGAEHGMHVEVYDRSEIEKIGMGALLAVAQGTAEPPKFIVLEYEGARTDSSIKQSTRKKKKKPIVLVGKSVTFDSGGVSLKPSDKMELMKYDMSGGATVLGVMRVVAELNLPIHIVALLPATDNMPSGTAVHPGDVVTTLSGKTVEVINTDAEGRLCLADALTYAARYKPAAIIDLATLTGACVVALGQHAIGLMGNDQKLISQIENAGRETGERAWQLPLWESYFNQIKSDVADLKNVGGRGGGAITAGLFLKQFVGKTPWVHLDIAGTAWNHDGGHPYIPKGATGIPLRLLIQFLSNLTMKSGGVSR